MAVSMRSWAAVAVIILWGVVLGWLGLRRVGQSDAARISRQAALRLAPAEAWFKVMAGSSQFGYAGITLDTVADGTYRIREQVNLEIPDDSGLTRAIRSAEYYLGAGLTVDSLVARRTTLAGTEVIRATARAGGWQLELRPGDSVVAATGRLVLGDDAAGTATLVPIRVVPLRLGLVGAIATGDARRLVTVDGWPPAAMEAETFIAGDSVAVFADSSDMDPATGRWVAASTDTVATKSLRLNSPAGPVRLAVDSRGGLVEIEYPFGARWVREDFSIARFNFRNQLDQTGRGLRDALPIIRPLAGSGSAADTSRGRRTWQVARRDGTTIDSTMLAMFAGGRQVVSAGGRLSVIPPIQVRSREVLPRQAEPWAQSGDSAIAAFAATLAPQVMARDLDGAMAGLRASVRLDTAAAAAVDARGALRAGRARPDGLARLVVAVLVELDIPARYVIGVLPRGDTLYTHAWVEYAWPGSNWDTVDPLTGRQASTGLIRLARAGSSHPQDLILQVADVRFTPVVATAPEGVGP